MASVKSVPQTILVVEDDPAMRGLLVDVLSNHQFQVIEAEDGDEAVKRVRGTPPDLIVTDLQMPGGGFEYLRSLRRLVPRCPIIVLSVFGYGSTRLEAMGCGVDACFGKPVPMTTVQVEVRRLLGASG